MDRDELGYWSARLRQDLLTQVRLLYDKRQKETGLTLKQLGELACMSERAARENLSGMRRIDMNVMSDLARAMGGRIEVTVTDLKELTND